MRSSYQITVNFLIGILEELKSAGGGEMLVVHGTKAGCAPIPINGILNAPVGTLEGRGDYIMSEEEFKGTYIPDSASRQKARQ